MVEDKKQKDKMDAGPKPKLTCKFKDKSFLEDFAPTRRDSDSSTSSLSPKEKLSKNENAFMRSGGGLQGLLWSNKGVKHGIMSPLAKRISGNAEI